MVLLYRYIVALYGTVAAAAAQWRPERKAYRVTANVLRKNNVQISGSGDRALVFGHGFGTDQTAWHFQELAFAPYYQVVRFDHVGAGGSDADAFQASRYASYDAYVDDLLDICAALKLRDAVYIGHSMGALIGARAALEQPQRFERLVMVAASPRYLNEPGYQGGFVQADLDQIYALIQNSYADWSAVFTASLTGVQPQVSPLLALASKIATVPPAVALTVAHTVFEADERALLPQIRQPTLLLHATGDRIAPPAIGEYMAHSIPHSQLQLIDTVGHLPHLSAPDAVNAAIAAFIGAASVFTS
jgi:sigma-B regulation protein RsbQ